MLPKASRGKSLVLRGGLSPTGRFEATSMSFPPRQRCICQPCTELLDVNVDFESTYSRQLLALCAGDQMKAYSHIFNRLSLQLRI